MLSSIQTAVILLSLIINHPAMAEEIKASQPVVSNVIVAKEEIKFDFTSPAVVKTYIESKAVEKGIDPKLASRIAKCESGFVPQQSKYHRPDGSREHTYQLIEASRKSKRWI